MNLRKTLKEKYNKFSFIILLIAILLLPIYVLSGYNISPSSDDREEEQDEKIFQEKLIARFDSNSSEFELEIAETREQWTIGLMNRRNMDKEKGMVFIFPEESMQAFWMKNTYIPLDIIFLDSNQEVVNIEKNAVPLNETNRYRSISPARYVIELNAGVSDKYNIKPGDTVSFSSRRNI